MVIRRFNFTPISILLGALCFLSACASSLPSNFIYETSLRGEQGFAGSGARAKSAKAILEGGLVSDPALALKLHYPNQDTKVKKWGLRYFNKNWSRYQVILHADIGDGERQVKCREVSTESPAGAPTLAALRAKNGRLLQSELQRLVDACAARAKAKP